LGSGDDMAGQLHQTRLQRAVFRTLGDLSLLAVRDSAVTERSLRALADRPAAITLESAPAFPTRKIPTGYQQSIPGTLVMFMLIVLMTGGTVQLFEDRKQGLLRRLASSPLTRREIVASRVVARTMIGLIMVVFAFVVGVVIFHVDWGGANAPFAVLLLLVYALAISGIAILLGSLARSEGQAVGLGVVTSIVISALGGCWWPIEIVPRPMQILSMFLPTGWAMQGLHRLMELGQGPASALPAFGMLALYAIVMLAIAARKFRFD
jgi:ABC-type multidrug transport system permease subunit